MEKWWSFLLSKIKMVELVPLLYTGSCDVIEKVELKKDSGATGFSEMVVAENVPCRVSYSSKTSAKNSDGAYQTTQTTKLFIAPDVDIKIGSKIVVTQNGVITEYGASGEKSTYSGHQEIVLNKLEWT